MHEEVEERCTRRLTLITKFQFIYDYNEIKGFVYLDFFLRTNRQLCTTEVTRSFFLFSGLYIKLYFANL